MNSTFGLFLQVVPITLLTGVIYVALRNKAIKKNKLPFAWKTEIFRLLFVCYLTGLVNLVLVPQNFWGLIWFRVINGYTGGNMGALFNFDFNFVPIIVKWLSGEMMFGSWVKAMLSLNLLMFVPMGFFLPFVSKKISKKNIWVISFAIPLVIELVQPIIGRAFDIDDIILNFFGIVISYFITIGILSLFKQTKYAK